MNIAVLGSINMDLVVQTDRMPQIGETLKGKAIHFIPGGKGANQAVAVARQQVPVSIIGCLGNDDFGKQQIRNLKQEGINTDFMRMSDKHSTGVASIVVDTQSRNQIIIIPGANEAITHAQIDKAADRIKKANYLICQLEVNFDAVEHALDIAFSNDTKVILNPAPARVLPPELLKKIDFLIPNETEATLISGIQVEDQHSAKEAGNKLIQQGVKNVLITLGAQGVMVVTQNAVFYEKALSVEAVDTTAAGDVFIGYFATAMEASGCIKTAVKKAQAAAALTVTKLGAQTSIPSLEQTEAFIQTIEN